MNKELALNGGTPVISHNFSPYSSIGIEEIESVRKVMETGVLSKFSGTWHPDFYGGPKVRAFEKDCAEFFGVKHAVAVNSWTSGLTAAIGVIGLEPGDEVIVSPWTMGASATAIIHWNGIPVFADIEAETFCLDPVSVEAAITPYTKAIIAVDIFGQSSDIDCLMEIAKKHKLQIISDTAQAPGAHYKGKHAGTLTHIGGYSLNYHKHIHTGEGGIVVTHDEDYAERIRLIRNHAEEVVEGMKQKNLINMIGHNYRMGEIEATIGIEQLKKLTGLVASRQRAAEQLSEGLKELPGLLTPVVRSNCTHVYYVYPLILDIQRLGVSRQQIYEVLSAEGVPGLALGYRNLHLLPMYQKRIAYGSKGFPWSIARRNINYEKGICPIAEKLHDEEYMGILMCSYEYHEDDVDLMIEAFQKVWENLDSLQSQ